MNNEIEHYPWCAAVQNMARPRSQQLIGPRCECVRRRKELDEFKKSIENGEFDEALKATDNE